jgi:sugar lactone lactonase YvrE
VGPDGNLWFTEFSQNTLPGGARSLIGRITPLGAITEFPLPTTSSEPGALTVGPDGNLWFGDDGTGSIGRITPSGAVTEFHLHKVSSDPFAPGLGTPTVGPDGYLWFSDGDTASIGRINLSPPRVTGVVAVANSRGAITSILVSFDEALAPASAGKVRYYGLAAGVESGQTISYSKQVKIARVSYERGAHAVRLKLAVPQTGPVKLTVRAGFVAADGTKSSSEYTAVVM